jgi:transposase
MNKTKSFIGIDISAETFISSIYSNPKTEIITSKIYSNSIEGFDEFYLFLKEHKLSPNNSLICFESTGVYSEKIAYYFFEKEYKVVQEHPLKVKRAFKISNDKTDAVDSKQIAEYAYRFCDELILWQPRQEIIEKMKQILFAREMLVKHKTAIKNSFTSYKKHEIQVNLISKIHEQTINFLTQQIKSLEKELDELIKKKLEIAQAVNRLETIPAVGRLLACSILVITDEFKTKNYKQLSAYIGIVPYKYESGSSVKKRPRSRNYGHNLLKKLLCLASLSVITHDKNFKRYFLRRVEDKKPKRIILNNIANKIIKLCYALLKNNTVYIENYKSINPILLR